MPKVTFVDSNGKSRELDAQVGDTLMHVALNADIDEIIGECGGSLMCATCHVYVDDKYLPLLSEVSSNEELMLEGTSSERKDNSRLSCQITMSDALDGIIVHLPDSQI